jgi:NAD-dependent DNA ligase
MVTIPERIKALRSQMLIHSRLYYILDDPIISDEEWQRRANELATLQGRHGTRINWYDEEFSDWTGDTGCHLPSDSWVIHITSKVRKIHRDLTGS